ncbi:MAG: PglZ domain-containing protein, partial [Actinomycetota bacterium]
EEPVDAQAVTKVRAAYAECVRVMTEGFVSALSNRQWDAGWDLPQTRIFDENVRPEQSPVAFFVVDAFRFEMARELADRLDQADQVDLRAAVAAIPTITPVGMAALLPCASTSFSVRETASAVAGAIDDVVLPDWPARWKHLQTKVPGCVELRLETVLHHSPKALAEKVKGARLVLVRSQDIDAVGEAGVGLVAQQAMATVIPNLARAIHRLSQTGLSRFVVSADHGHLLDVTQDDDMKIGAPGGDRVDLHRRCWAGRGGDTPAGAIRVSGADLGYDTDLDFVFPTGRGVFLSGGDLRYHHGGLSLQEMIVPLLTIKMEKSSAAPGPQVKVRLHDVPERITNRTLGVRVELAADLFAAPHGVRVVLLHEAEQVGEAGMVQGATMDPRTKRIELTPGQPATVGLMLSRDDCKTVRLVVFDAETDAVMAQSKNLNVSLSI